MTSILLVEDDELNRTMIARALTRAGHEVTEATGGEEAISVGSRFRPSVLIADWMLQNPVHGLHVAQALQLVDPGIQTILMTGYPSQDLFDACGKCGAGELLTKPFRLAELQRAVERATRERRSEPGAADEPTIGVLEVDASGAIPFENAAASKILDRVRRRGDRRSLRDLLHDRDFLALRGATDRWVEISPKCNQALRWAIRARSWPALDRRLLVLCSASDHGSRSDPRIKALLGIGFASVPRWPFEGRVLLIDAERSVRANSVDSLERAGCTCYTAESHGLALRLIETDSGIHYVVLGCERADEEMRLTIEQIRGLRPDIVLVGSGGNGVREEFAALGMDLFVPRPWRTEDLIETIQTRFVDPPRMPTPRASAWEEDRFSPARDSRSAARSSSRRLART
jgi:DNA-binding NtrC family response regulator